jgi:hypothetical protein
MSKSKADTALPLSCDMLLRGCSAALASPVVPSALGPQKQAAALSACKLDSDLPNCSWLAATFPLDLLEDVRDADRCGRSMIPAS